MTKITTLALAIVFSIAMHAQKSQSPYEWDWTKDGIWTGAALGGTVGGFLLIQNKDDLTEAEFAAEIANQDNINFIDKWAVGNHSESANMVSDIPFFLSFAAPIGLLFDDETNDHTAQVLGLYLESMATTGAMYTITAGLVNRSRPYVYDDSGDTTLRRRMSSNGQRSFYSGHVAATATATFFTAKVLTDFNPEMKGQALVWTGAAVIPAAVGYFRIQGGQHFLTDVLLGYGLGAVTGYLVPELHKTENTNVSLYPTGGINLVGDEYKAMAVRYTF
ncbi:phosphatase PAP2 family protein [Jejudonia soesokkakensis]|uniref:Phosphatase PAP2 family protein n=1 Tax=Jejudonia soesokkakensis TaxID=1323432 RepID=A0ABW2MVA7_9FLAO